MGERAGDPRFEGKQLCNKAMRALRDAEDYVRLTVGDDVWADRIRCVHEHLTDDVLRGTTKGHRWLRIDVPDPVSDETVEAAHEWLRRMAASGVDHAKVILALRATEKPAVAHRDSLRAERGYRSEKPGLTVEQEAAVEFAATLIEQMRDTDRPLTMRRKMTQYAATLRTLQEPDRG